MINPLGNLIGLIHRHRPAHPGRFVMPYLVVALSITTAASLYTAINARTFAGDLRDGLVASCEKNGNTLREVLREEQLAALTDADDPRIRAILPNVPHSVIVAIVRQGNREHRERLRKLRPVDCPSQYP